MQSFYFILFYYFSIFKYIYIYFYLNKMNQPTNYETVYNIYLVFHIKIIGMKQTFLRRYDYL